MSEQSFLSPSRVLRSNYMDALSQSPAFERRSSAPDALSSPESSPSVGFIEMSDLMLPASALECELFGVPQDSSATVVSTASYDETVPSVITTTSPRSNKRKSSSAASERRHSLPSTLMLSQSPLGEAVTQPVPEFLCHLFSMLRDPSYSDLISWSVPSHDEPDHMGGGIRGMGKIIVQKPEALQDFVLGKYYRHSKYASFQRQLNYFGFKKRLHGGKKGKLSPCSYIHESLTADVGSLFGLKRRPPPKKRLSEDMGDNDCSINRQLDCSASVSSHEDPSAPSLSRSKKRRVTAEKKTKKSKKNRSKKDKKKQEQGKQQVMYASKPLQVQAEEYGPTSPQSSDNIDNHQYQVQTNTTTSIATPMCQVSEPSIALNQSTTSSPECQPTLLELLSTCLPPSDILFDDAVDADWMDDEGIPAWVTGDGKYHYHNVDSSLIDLAMLY